MLHDALAAGDWPRALVLALDQWRTARSPALADLIDIVSASCARKPVVRRDEHEYWMRAAMTYEPVEAARLVALAHYRIAKCDSSWEHMRERLGLDRICELFPALEELTLGNWSFPEGHAHHLPRLIGLPSLRRIVVSPVRYLGQLSLAAIHQATTTLPMLEVRE